jgi:phosphoglycerol transferase
MASVTCLTDILARDGYRTEFVKGFDLGFAGTDAFLRSHRYDRAMGLHEYPGYSGPFSEWGAYDDGLYDFALGEVKRLREAGEPFYFTLTTNGGHFPNGVVSPECGGDPERNENRLPLVAALDCTNRLTGRFIDRLEKAGLLENTIVVLQSDHLMMLNPLDAKLDAHSRRNLFIAFGPGVPQAESDRPASMVDVYPTLLELLGYSLPEHRAALGVSLLSDKPTLIEELGKDELDHSIGTDMHLARSLWSSDGKAVGEMN